VINKIKKFFLKFNIKIIVYLRRQDQWLQSLYREHIKLPNSEKGTFADFICPYPLKYEVYLEPWRDIFGTKNVFIRSYDYIVNSKKTIISDFCSTIGLDLNRYEIPKKRSNPTLPNITLELIRASNHLEMKHTKRSKLNFQLQKFCIKENYQDIWSFFTSEDFKIKYKKSNEKIEQYMTTPSFFFDNSDLRVDPPFVSKKLLFRKLKKHLLPYYSSDYSYFLFLFENIKKYFYIQQ
jgi:hypothetical protein